MHNSVIFLFLECVVISSYKVATDVYILLVLCTITTSRERNFSSALVQVGHFFAFDEERLILLKRDALVSFYFAFKSALP